VYNNLLRKAKDIEFSAVTNVELNKKIKVLQMQHKNNMIFFGLLLQYDILFVLGIKRDKNWLPLFSGIE
jgi:hypothetical protein